MNATTGLAESFKELANEIMQNYPEYSNPSLTCIRADYKEGRYTFLDEEEGKQHVVTVDMVAEALPKVQAELAGNKLFLYGLHSGAESFMDPGNWDSPATDAAVQMAVFGQIIYG